MIEKQLIEILNKVLKQIEDSSLNSNNEEVRNISLGFLNNISNRINELKKMPIGASIALKDFDKIIDSLLNKK